MKDYSFSPSSILTGALFLVFLSSSCSTTKNLPEGEVLYTGQKAMRIENLSKTPTGLIAMEEIETALATPPNNSFLGSSRIRIPLPTGLWIYNRFVNSKGRLGKWIFNRFAAQPVFISAVNPNIRVKVASNLLHDYGYFNGTVNYEVLPDEKNPRKAKLQYAIDMKNPYVLDSIAYERFPPEMKQALLVRNRRPLIHKDDPFSVVKLDEERNRLSALLRNRGYYYLRPDFISYRADTTRISGKVDLQITPKAGLPKAALQQWRIGDIAVHLYGVNDEAPNESLQYENINIRYYNKLKVRPEVLKKSIRLVKGRLFTEWSHTQTQSKLTELGIFRYAEIQYASPRRRIPGEIRTDSVLNVTVKTAYDLPYDSELELNIATKSNDQTGPGVAYNVTKRNVFGGGETFSVRLRGSYEWQNRTPAGESASVINSYELGGAASLVFPGVLLPKIGGQEYNFPATTTFHLNAAQLNRARFFKMLSFGGDATYTFQPTRMHRHVVTPFKLTFNTLQRTTKEFDDVINANPILSRSLSNQFIPAMGYTYTYDNANYISFRRRRHNLFRVEASFTSAGNVTSLIYKLAGKGFGEQKDLLGAHFAQFLKLTADVRYTWYIDKNQSITTRFSGGILHSYGNSTVSPYSEQFFIGGANSIRAFTVRSIGPGSYRSEGQS
ncbi:Outer membrane protein assembly factor BamA, partial [termite gut metagenome]